MAASSTRSPLDVVPVEVVCSILEWESDFQWIVRAAQTSRAFAKAVASVIENKLTANKEVSEVGVWRMTNHQRTWYRQVFVNLRHMCHGVLEVIKDIDCSKWKGETDRDTEKIAEAFSILERAPGRKGLRSMNLSFGRHITDASVLEIAKLNSLESLNLAWCSNVTSASLKAFQGHPNLRVLTLESCRGITTVSDLVTIPQLEVLNLAGCMGLQPTGLQGFSRLSHLRHLNLSYCNLLVDEDVEEVAHIQSLRTLNLSFCWNLTDRAARALAAATWLEELDLRQHNQMTPDGVALIQSRVPGLRSFQPPQLVTPSAAERQVDESASDSDD
jgi:hypothetical protein